VGTPGTRAPTHHQPPLLRAALLRQRLQSALQLAHALRQLRLGPLGLLLQLGLAL
jgi:hypothetical protein